MTKFVFREPVVIDTEKEKKGQTMMDALLSMFTFKTPMEENKGMLILLLTLYIY